MWLSGSLSLRPSGWPGRGLAGRTFHVVRVGGIRFAHQKPTPRKSSWIFSGIFQRVFSVCFSPTDVHSSGRRCLRAEETPAAVQRVALLVQRYLSNTASFVFYGITCLIRLIELAALFNTFEENMCQTSSVRQVVPPEFRRGGSRAWRLMYVSVRWVTRPPASLKAWRQTAWRRRRRVVS